MDRWIEQLVAGLRDGQAADVAGSRAVVDVALTDRLLNQAIADLRPPGGAVREVTVRVTPGQARVRLRMARPAFLPPLDVTVTIERQADLPASPLVVLRLGMPRGLGLLVGAGASLLNALPPGFRLDGERLAIDLATVLRDRGLAWVLQYMRALLVTLEDGRVRVQASVDAGGVSTSVRT